MSTRTLVFNDVHGPWEDKKSLALVLDVAASIHIDRIVINGDLLDFYNLNSHGPKHPDVMETLESELEWGQNFIKELRDRFPKKEIIYIFGNHEHRLDRFIVKNCKAFHNILTLKNQLQLDKYNIKMIPYNQEYQLEDTSLYIQHSPPSYSANGAAVSLARKSDSSYIWGCTHRMQHASKTGKNGTYHAFFNGWLGSTDASDEHKEVFSYTKGHSNWQQCFSLVAVHEGDFHVQPISIVNHKCVVDGFVYEI